MIRKGIILLYVVIIILGIELKVNAQEQQSGLYFLREATKDCPYAIVNKSKTASYCTGSNAIIALKEFGSVSEIYEGEITAFFEVFLKKDGQNKFKSILASKIDLKLGLVNNGELLGVIDTQGGSIYNKFRVYSSTNSITLEIIRANLVAILNE